MLWNYMNRQREAMPNYNCKKATLESQQGITTDETIADTRKSKISILVLQESQNRRIAVVLCFWDCIDRCEGRK